MELLTAGEMCRAEELADSSGLSYLRMMENAGSAVARFLEQEYPQAKNGPVVVLCGKGNNGGDGFVVARRLAEKGVAVSVILVCGQPVSLSSREMFGRLASLPVEIVDAKTSQWSFVRQLMDECSLAVDGVFGTGFSGELPPLAQECFLYLERKNKPVVAIDLPSGACADTGRVAPATPRCVATVTFHAYKYAHILYPAREYCGVLRVADIGLPVTPNHKVTVLEKQEIAPLLHRKEGDTHKGTFGKAGLLVGSRGMAGAALFSIRSCLRCGVGLAYPVLPEELYPLVAPFAPEGVYRLYEPDATSGQVAALCRDTDALLVGCGLGTGQFVKETVGELIRSYPAPLVLDADGINSLGPHINALKEREGATVITPHPGEMARLLKTDIQTVQANRFAVAQKTARELGVITVLKGAGTVIAAPDGRLAVSLTGNSGLSKGGSGDVLAGMILSFCAQGMEPFWAACAGVWLHGKAGQMAGKAFSRRSVLPTDVIETLPDLFLSFEE